MNDIINTTTITLDLPAFRTTKVEPAPSIADSLTSLLGVLRTQLTSARDEEVTRINSRIEEIESILSLRNW